MRNTRWSIQHRIIVWFTDRRGFTVAELLSASLLTLFFFGWLTYAYVTVTRAALAWQEDWGIASETSRALARLCRDLEYAALLDTMSATTLRLTRTDGATVVYAQRADGVYRNDRRLDGAGGVIASFHLTAMGESPDSVGVQAAQDNEGEEAVPAPPLWLRIAMHGQADDQSYAARTTVRLYSLRPAVLLREEAHLP